MDRKCAGCLHNQEGNQTVCAKCIFTSGSGSLWKPRREKTEVVALRARVAELERENTKMHGEWESAMRLAGERSEWVDHYERAESERRAAEQRVMELEGIISDLTARAFTFGDKPHQLFSCVRAMAERYACDSLRNGAVQKMDEAYENARTLSSAVAAEQRVKRLEEALRPFAEAGRIYEIYGRGEDAKFTEPIDPNRELARATHGDNTIGLKMADFSEARAALAASGTEKPRCVCVGAECHHLTGGPCACGCQTPWDESQEDNEE